MTETKPVTEESTEEDLIPKEQLPQEGTPKLGETPAEPAPAEQPAEIPTKGEPAPGETTPEGEVAPAEPTVSVVPSQPTPVEGETPREKGLRNEVTRLRTIIRGDGVKNAVDSTAPAPDADPYAQLIEDGYTTEEIQKMEVAVDLIAKNKGYVRAGDSYKDSVKDTVDSFVEENPEYSPAKDTDDVRWNLFTSILNDGTYNLAGRTPKQLRSILSKVNDDVKKQLGEPVTVVANKNQVAAQQHKVNIASHSGGTKTTSKEEARIDYNKPIGGIVFKGFGEEE